MFPRILVMAAALTMAATIASADQARQRWPDQNAEQGGGDAAPRTAVPRGEAPREAAPPPQPREAAPPPAPRPSAAPPEPARPQGSRVREAAPTPGQRTAQPRQRWPEEPQQGVAVPRQSVPPPQRPGSGSGTYGSRVYSSPRVYNNYYYYPRRYYPYGYGSFGLGYFYYDPYTWYPYDNYRYDNYGYAFRGYGYGYPTGELRLQVRPRHADVYVDGYFAGRVDDFDGMIQALRLEDGPYTIELVAPGYEPLLFNVRIIPGRKITYRGDMRPIRP